MCKAIRNIEAMMFDLDGTLIDSIPAYFDLLETIFNTLGLPQPEKPLKKDFISRGPVVFEKMIPDQGDLDREAVIQQCFEVGRRLSRDMFRNSVRVFPGVKELFALLTQQGISIGIVSTTEREFIERKLQPLTKENISAAVEVIIAIEDAPRRKPAPDPLIECARRLSAAPERCVYVGDSVVDIRAGKAAGMHTIGVLSGLADIETFHHEQPTMVLESVYDIWEKMHESE
jgi:HAD superfamily hydrolase (TIGR01662 family)